MHAVVEFAFWSWVVITLGVAILRTLVSLYQQEPKALTAYIALFIIGWALVIMSAKDNASTIAPVQMNISPQQARQVG